jgi:hypothetical protein
VSPAISTLNERGIEPLAATQTTITAIETKTARPFNLRVEGNLH